jgi:hypothetical protein
MASNKKGGAGKAVAGLVGLTAALGAVYAFYSSDEAAANRKKAKVWVSKAKTEILEHAKNVKGLREENYHKVVDSVSKKYKALKNVDPKEVASLVNDLKKHWSTIQKSISSSAAKSEKDIKKEGKAGVASIKKTVNKIKKDVSKAKPESKKK